MVFQNLLTKMAPVYMHIDFCGGNILVSQHSLNSTQVGTAFQQMGGETVAEGMRAYIFLYSSPLGIILDIDKKGNAT